MFMDTIKSIIDKFKTTNSEKPSFNNLVCDANSALDTLNSKKLLKDFTDWETKAMQSLAKQTVIINECIENINTAVENLQEEKAKFHNAALEVYKSHKLVYDATAHVDASSPLYPWDSPAFIAYLGLLRNESKETEDKSIETLVRNTFVTHTLNASSAITPASGTASTDKPIEKKEPLSKTSDTGNLIDDLCLYSGATLSLFLQGSKPVLTPSKLEPGDQDEINEIIVYLIQTAVNPILNYSFEGKSQEELDAIVPLFEKYAHALQSLHTVTTGLLNRIEQYNKPE